MKAIIEGKRYDTDTADQVAYWSNGYNFGDFGRCEETLYRTTKGAWFLHGEGGARSRYARHVGNGSCGGEAIEALTAEQARVWLELRQQTVGLEKHFPAEIDDA